MTDTVDTGVRYSNGHLWDTRTIVGYDRFGHHKVIREERRRLKARPVSAMVSGVFLVFEPGEWEIVDERQAGDVSGPGGQP